MPTDRISLAIETSSAIDSIAVGRGDQLLETTVLPPRRPGRSNHLMSAVAELFDGLKIARTDLEAIYVSVGPGSFTGLRIGIATAQMLAATLNAKTVAVPTLNVVAQNAPQGPGTLLVCLNQKRDTVYAGTFRHDGQRWVNADPARVTTIAGAIDAAKGIDVAESIDAAARPVQLLSQTKLDLSTQDTTGVAVLPTELAMPWAAIVWQLGRDAAANHAYTAAPQLLPIYARVPEAVELWDKRHPRS